ncbi:lipocalin family protein [Flavobacterium sp. PLA-1-15]|uniref:lipocalin family protein n=1 Tax=Flavobacterium sp. PLA-1-15 TaxID=3380533 RepID=UPI003B7FF3F6
MKKQNLKTTVLLLFISSLLINLSSCSGSDDNENSTSLDKNKLYGKWEFYRYLDSTNEEGYGLYEHGCEDKKDYLEFQMTESRFFHQSWDTDCEQFTATGNWSLSNQNITINAQDEFESYQVTVEVLELTDNKLVVKETEANGDFWIDELRKIN